MRRLRGSVNQRRFIFIADTSSTTGAGLANLTHSSSGLVAYYIAGDLNNEVQITLVSGTLGTYVSGGFVAVDNTNMPGWYEVGIPDAALDGGNQVAIQYRGAANMAPVNIYIELDAVDYQDSAAFGLSRLNDTITSRMASYTQPTGFLGATFPASVANETTVASRASQASVDAIPTNPLLTNDSRLNNLDFSIAAVNTAIGNLNNLSALINLYGAPLMEIPDSGTTVYAFTIVVRDNEGKLVNLDTSPTLAASNAVGTDRSANLSAVSNPATGRYTFTYSVANTHAKEPLRITASGNVSTEARYVEWVGAVVDYDTLTTLQAVQTTVNGIDSRLPASPAAVGDIPTVGAIADAVLEESVDDHDGVAHSLAKYISIIKKANTVVDGTVTSASTPTATAFSSNVSYPTGAFKHAVLLWLTGALAEQNSPILTYNNTNGAITVEEPFTSAPQVGDQFIIIPTTHVHSVAAIAAGVGNLQVLTRLDSMIEDNGSGQFRFDSVAVSLAGGGGGTDWTTDERTAIRSILGFNSSGALVVPSAGVMFTITTQTANLFKYGDAQRWNSPANQIDVTITKVP